MEPSFSFGGLASASTVDSGEALLARGGDGAPPVGLGSRNRLWRLAPRPRASWPASDCRAGRLVGVRPDNVTWVWGPNTRARSSDITLATCGTCGTPHACSLASSLCGSDQKERRKCFQLITLSTIRKSVASGKNQKRRYDHVTWKKIIFRINAVKWARWIDCFQNEFLLLNDVNKNIIWPNNTVNKWIIEFQWWMAG